MSKVEMDSRGLDRLLRELPKEADKVVRKAAFDITREAQALAPVDKSDPEHAGELRDSIEMVDEQLGDAEAEVVVGEPFGTYVEFGTSRAAAQPFLTPAVEKVRPQFEKALASLVKRLGSGE